MAGEGDAVILIILAWIFPPVAVALLSGCGPDLCLNILLTILGWLPGCLHAFWLVLKRAEANDRYGYKNWTYAGMGKYRPAHEAPPGVQPSTAHGQPQPPPPAPPPPGQYSPPGVPPQSQASVDQKGGYTAPPAPAESTQYSGEKGADPSSAPPPAPADQKYSQAPPQAPGDQKQVDSTTAQSTAPASST
ncbi:hypothetical protein JVT61DRAFT_6303 [Boletus reticuloceps]|uniref:Uncharacterized protein n=1 Tax=Boletus reticuloceps TaxID=495285 RepID=A0A8I2YIK6_9AGAM|nr:hypothetical protein JVT61DRAFT_7483 [Boletus reticuloceps]KAG6373640.1 hypothetical protein JVT61DRAFT_6303 [Boletus reticuloceps]